MANNTIQKTSSKGQITLPKIWRSQFNTSHFALKWQKDYLTIKPIDVDKMINEMIIFSANRDNEGQGIPMKKLIRILKRIDG